MVKQCKKCLIVKSIDEYYTHKQMADGYLNICKLCQSISDRTRYRRNIIARKAYEQQRKLTPKRMEQRLRYLQKSRAMNLSKAKARDAVSNAIRDKRLARLPCEVCGELKVQAHHSDYRSPLKVNWLCFKHHRELHGQVIV